MTLCKPNDGIFVCLGILVASQATSDNTPPILWLDRDWRIPANEPVGSVVTRVHADDNEHDKLVYGLEARDHLGHPTKELPFRIDPDTGVVYTNRSLADRVSQTYIYMVESLYYSKEDFIPCYLTFTRRLSHVRFLFLSLFQISSDLLILVINLL